MKKSLNNLIRLGMCFLVFFMSLLVVFVELLSINRNGEAVLGTEDVYVDGKIGLGGDDKKVEISEVVLADDARYLLLENYLKRYKSPLVPYAGLILELSDTFEFDYRWIVAIAQQESNLCKKIPTDSHNCWGYGIHSRGTLKFESYDLALRSFATYLKKSYFDKGLDTPELIMAKYCPHSNGSWAFGIRQFFGDIEAGK